MEAKIGKYVTKLFGKDTTGTKDMIICPACDGNSYIKTDVGSAEDCWLCDSAGKINPEDATYDKITGGA
tara:strand:- start:494 stop:700 length:207 start_codon:yes stop_codon:yes gene_type:complete